MSLSTKSIEHPVTTVMVYVLLCGLAAVFIPRLAVAMNPDTDMPVLSVSTSYEGAGPEDVEQNVTKVLENALSSVEGLEDLSSTSSTGSSRIMLEFDFGTDLDASQNEVESVIGSMSASLPSGADSPQVTRFNASSMPIMSLGIRGNLSTAELAAIAEERIEPLLERIEGVAQARVAGGAERIIDVRVSPGRLAAYSLSLSAVVLALQGQKVLLSGGTLVRGSTEYHLKTSEALSSVEEVKAFIIKTVNPGEGAGTRAVRLEDVAEVKLGTADPSQLVYIDGVPGVSLQIMRDSDSNAVQIAKAVRGALASLNGSLPDGVQVDILSDDTTLVTSTLNAVYDSAWQGILLSIVILLIYLRNIKATLIIAASIPICILATLLGMYFLGLTLNTISLTGLILALGMVVDASIVIVDNVFRYRERGARPLTAARLGTQEMITAIMGSTLTTICVFIPIILFRNDLGMMGQLFNDLVFTVVISLVVSLAVAMTLVPVLAGPVMRMDTRVQKPLHRPFIRKIDGLLERFFTAQEAAYSRALAFCLRNRLAVIALVALLFVSALLQFQGFGINLFPNAETDDSLSVELVMPAGTTLAATYEVLHNLEAFVKSNVQGYESLVLTAGGGGGGGPMGGSSGSNQGSLKILLPEPSRQIDSPKTIQTRLSGYLAGIPGADISFTSGRRFSSGSAVDIEIRSKDQAASLAAARQIESLVAAKFPAARNLGISLESGAPELRFRIDRDRATLHGFTVAAVAAELRASVYGSTATSIDMEGESLDVIVRLREEDRKSLEDLESIFLIDAQGQSIPLSDFVTVIAGSAPETIARENKERIIHVEGDTDGSIPTTEVSSLLRQILDEGYVEREGVTVSLGGERMDIERISGVFLLIIGLAVFLVYGVMASQFESFIDPLVIFFSIPLMLIGVVWIYRLTNDTFSLFSAVGLVALAGVVVNNGIVLVDYTNTLRARGLALFEACTEAGRHRLRPILMSTLTTVLGIAPLALFPGAGSENIQPIAKTMLGGLTVQSVITLFLTPVLYSIFNGRSERLNRKKLRQLAGMAGEERVEAAAPDKEPAVIPELRIEEVTNDKE